MQILECNTTRRVGCNNEADVSDYGEINFSVEVWSVFVASLVGGVSISGEGAELGPHAPLIQVATPNRGRTHACKMNQRTRTPTGIRNSIVLLSRSGV